MGKAGVTLAGCQTFLARRLNQSHGQVGRPSLLGNGGLLPNCFFRDVMEKWADQVFKEVGLPVLCLLW